MPEASKGKSILNIVVCACSGSLEKVVIAGDSPFALLTKDVSLSSYCPLESPG